MSAAGTQLLLLARNEFRLYLRSGFLHAANMGFLMLALMLLHAAALGVALINLAKPASGQGPPYLLALGLIVMLLLMTSRALGGAVQSLYTRGDLDLLLASPVDRRAILGVRMGSLAAVVAAEVALLVWPFANVFVLFGRVAWFKAYLLVPAMAMLATSIALCAVWLSFRTIGPRRTRVGIQVVAAVVGLGMMLAIYMPRGGQTYTAGVLRTSAEFATSQGGIGQWLMAPANLLMQGPLPVIVFLLAATALIAFTVQLAGEPIVRTLTGIGSGGGGRSRRAAAAPVKFRSSLRGVIVLKELKLIARDPYLITQILAQSVMVLPMAFVLWNTQILNLPLAWMATIVAAAGIAGPLAWITVLAEDAPDLLAAAPVTRAALVRAKLEAAMLPVLPLCVAPVLFLLVSHPWYGICTSACAFGAALSGAMINMRNPVAQRRDSFKKRHQSSFGTGIAEMLSMAFWMLLCLGLSWLGTLPGWR